MNSQTAVVNGQTIDYDFMDYSRQHVPDGRGGITLVETRRYVKQVSVEDFMRSASSGSRRGR